jgi:mannose-6-phosphate isomerase-like protein (cupin superfamily)
LKTVRLKQAILRAKKLAEDKLAKGENADEFILIGEADGFKIYVTAGKTLENLDLEGLHENSRDIFMIALEGKIEFKFENGERRTVKAGECFVLPKHLKHRCTFKKMTITIEGVYEKGL